MSVDRPRVRTPIAPGHEAEGEICFWFDDAQTGRRVALIRYASNGAPEYLARQPGQFEIIAPEPARPRGPHA